MVVPLFESEAFSRVLDEPSRVHGVELLACLVFDGTGRVLCCLLWLVCPHYLWVCVVFFHSGAAGRPSRPCVHEAKACGELSRQQVSGCNANGPY